LGRVERVKPKCCGNGCCGPCEELEVYDEKNNELGDL